MSIDDGSSRMMMVSVMASRRLSFRAVVVVLSVSRFLVRRIMCRSSRCALDPPYMHTVGLLSILQYTL